MAAQDDIGLCTHSRPKWPRVPTTPSDISKARTFDCKRIQLHFKPYASISIMNFASHIARQQSRKQMATPLSSHSDRKKCHRFWLTHKFSCHDDKLETRGSFSPPFQTKKTLVKTPDYPTAIPLVMQSIYQNPSDKWPSTMCHRWFENLMAFFLSKKKYGDKIEITNQSCMDHYKIYIIFEFTK